MAALPEPILHGEAGHGTRPCSRPAWPALQPGRHAQRLDLALAHERTASRSFTWWPSRSCARSRRASWSTSGATTARAPGQRSRWSRATGCASSSPTACPSTPRIHWHGQRLPNGMDGVGGLNQPQIPVGKTFVYEFVARRPGTFMYHPHADEMTQMAMGMMGFWVTHPKSSHPLIERGGPRLLLPPERLRHRSRAAARPRSTRCSTSTSGPGTAGPFPASTA